MCIVQVLAEAKEAKANIRIRFSLLTYFSLLNYPQHFEMKIKKKNKDFCLILSHQDTLIPSFVSEKR